MRSGYSGGRPGSGARAGSRLVPSSQTAAAPAGAPPTPAGTFPEDLVEYDPTNGHNHDGSNSAAVSLAGDVTGDSSATSVSKIRGVPVPATTSGDDEKALVYDHTGGVGSTPTFKYVTPSGGAGSSPLVYAALYTPFTSPWEVANTTSETTFVPSHTVSGGTIGAGDVFQVRACGAYGTAAVPGNLTLRLKFGSTTLCEVGPIPVAASLSGMGWTLEAFITVTATGGFGQVQPDAALQLGTAINGAQVCLSPVPAGIVLDTSVALAITLTAEWDTADASNTISLRQFTIEHLT